MYNSLYCVIVISDADIDKRYKFRWILLRPHSKGNLLWSVCASVGPSKITCLEHVFSPLTQSGSYFTHRVFLDRECAVSLNQVSRTKVTVITELSEKYLSGSYIISP